MQKYPKNFNFEILDLSDDVNVVDNLKKIIPKGVVLHGYVNNAAIAYDDIITNINLDKLKPTEKWSEKLIRLMDYFENDSQLRDILITGGDALMSGDKSLEKILNAVYEMAKRKKDNNLSKRAFSTFRIFPFNGKIA